MFRKVCIVLDGSCPCTYYSAINVSPGDKVTVSTRFGITTGVVSSIIEEVDRDPFKEGHAKQRVLENATQKLFDKENVIMFGAKTVEVKHISSNRKGIFYTDLDLHVGQTVVYDGNMPGGKMYENSLEQAEDNEITSFHVGVVTNVDPDTVTAKRWIVDTVDLAAHKERIQRAKKATKLRAKLEAKRKQFQDIELLRLIAASDPDTKAMLDEYTTLIGGNPNA